MMMNNFYDGFTMVFNSGFIGFVVGFIGLAIATILFIFLAYSIVIIFYVIIMALKNILINDIY